MSSEKGGPLPGRPSTVTVPQPLSLRRPSSITAESTITPAWAPGRYPEVDAGRRSADKFTLPPRSVLDPDAPNLDAAPSGPPLARELDAFLAAEDGEAAYDWAIPGFLEHRDRLILTAPEGSGKSTLLRQIAVQAASGVHPFGADDFPPLRVLLIDLENSERQLRREFRPLRLAAGDRYASALFVQVCPSGLNLLDHDDKVWLHAVVEEHTPDLLITGPIYKLAAGDPIEESSARVVAGHFDRIRAEHGCAVLLEAHTPHGQADRKRPERPYGASLWLRWPEFGLYLSPEGYLRDWRGARDATRQFPPVLQRGGAWPWTPVDRQRDVVWAKIVALCSEAGAQKSVNALTILTGASHGSVQRAIAEHRAEWDAFASSQVTGGGTP